MPAIEKYFRDVSEYATNNIKRKLGAKRGTKKNPNTHPRTQVYLKKP